VLPKKLDEKVASLHLAKLGVELTTLTKSRPSTSASPVDRPLQARRTTATVAHPEQPNNFDVLFGTTAWRDALRLEGVARREFIHELYLAQLRRVGGARYVRSFEMRNKKNATDYFLFFATNSRKGIEKMKEAMWKVDESGEFRFSDATNPAQVLLFEKQPNLLELRRQLLVKFAGTTATVDEIEEFVLAETSFRETHYKKRLAELEREGRVVAVDPPRNRRGHSYPDPRLVLRFEPLSDDGQ
jgi:hypothetical protein